ncbi:hypothetical protein L6452_37699 [Arctium lappa]|uniref:Uncharacterized protein n=1 Tax=Arctium lappa TaxID=4217 RepID=A0ACB8Y2X2_ARCLA|nr:hypothetical protein L6452_37699 [Arctium lappa]
MQPTNRDHYPHFHAQNPNPCPLHLLSGNAHHAGGMTCYYLTIGVAPLPVYATVSSSVVQYENTLYATISSFALVITTLLLDSEQIVGTVPHDGLRQLPLTIPTLAVGPTQTSILIGLRKCSERKQLSMPGVKSVRSGATPRMFFINRSCGSVIVDYETYARLAFMI